MGKKKVNANQSSLDLVRYEFDNWRRTKTTRRERIPEQLWSAAATLTKQYSVNRVSKALGLNYTDLKNHIHTKRELKNKQAAFVELTGSDMFTPPECVVEMEDASGAKVRMCVRGQTNFDLLELGKSFWNRKR